MDLNKNLKIYYNNAIIFFFTSFIYLSFLKFEHFQFRYLILFLLIPCITFLFKDLKNKDYRFIKYFLFFLLFFLIHLLINFYLADQNISIFNILSLFFLLSIFTITYYFINFFNKNINKIIYLFIVIFICSSLISFLNFQLDNPYFCGGVPDVFNIINHEYENISKPSYATKISYKEYLFTENSHLGMIAPSLIAFMVHYTFTKNPNFIKKMLFVIFLVLCYIKSSTTLLVGLSLSFFIFLLFNNKELSKKTRFVFVLSIFFCMTIILLSDECKSRFIQVNNIHTMGIMEILTEEQIILGQKNNLEQKKNINIYQKFKNKIEYIILLSKNIPGSLTKDVHYYALSILKRSIIEKPFGWGINRYSKAFEYYNTKDQRALKKNINTLYLNKKDGTNNFIKILVEFGFFGLIFYFFILLFLIEKKISIELKLFYMPILIVQSIRGAGYFNGGFILIAFLMLLTYINFKKKIL